MAVASDSVVAASQNRPPAAATVHTSDPHLEAVNLVVHFWSRHLNEGPQSEAPQNGEPQSVGPQSEGPQNVAPLSAVVHQAHRPVAYCYPS